jgi:hypothetical protein
VHYEFRGAQHAVDTLPVTWYEAGKQPPRELFQAPNDWPGSTNGALFIGEKGNAFVGFPELPALFPREAFADFKMPDLKNDNHYQQWTNAILGTDKVSAPFSYSGPLTETVLLGNVAFRTGKRLEWNSEKLEAVGVPEAAQFVRRDYRKGWEVEGLG